MKNIPLFIFGFIVTCFLSCSSEISQEEMIQEQITNFYTTVDVEDYKPLSFSEFDTIHIIKDSLGSSREIVGIVLHGYQGIGENGDTTKFEDTFDVTIYQDAVVAIPRGY